VLGALQILQCGAQNWKPDCKRCLPEGLACAKDANCRDALGCIVTECVSKCQAIPVIRDKCDPAQCMDNNGTCGPSPACTLRCSDVHVQYTNEAFNTMLTCMAKEKCMAQMHGDWPSTKDCDNTKPLAAAVPNLDLSLLEGRWYINAGLNPIFDTYPCQVACARRVAEDRVNFTMWFDIPLDNGTNLLTNANQSFFAPDPSTPAHIRMTQDFMHGQDDWYIVAHDPKEEYWLVKYCGKQDTWVGYGGAVLYSRKPSFDKAWEPELRAAAARAGFSWDAMKLTENVNCGIESTPRFGCPAALDEAQAAAVVV